MNIFEARLRHEELARSIGLTDDEREEAWALTLEIKDVQYPPGPNEEQEKKLMALGKIFSRRLRLLP